MHNKLAQKLLSLGVSVSLMAATVPQMAWAAEPDKFVTSAKANHWGRSDLRAYLNNGLASVDGSGNVTNKNYGIDSTTGTYASNNTSGYAKQFSDAEFAEVEPFTYSTNVLDGSQNATATYETSDRFWLPSGNYDDDQITSWGREDISANSQYSTTTANDKARIIPISYWSRHDSTTYSWLRSPYYFYSDHALRATRGYDVIRIDVLLYNALACAFKIDLSSVIFASAASAASVAGGGADGAQKISISGSDKFGQKVSDALPDYGMYLKTEADSGVSFDPTNVTLSGTDLTVTYSGGEQGQYVVVHAFKNEDKDLENGTTSYAAAAKLGSDQTTVELNVAEWTDSEGNMLTSLDGYTIKVWMEDGSSGASLAKATIPVTFVGKVKTDAGAATNSRVFAMKKDLQCSWGNLGALEDSAYKHVIGGNGQDGTPGKSSNAVCGVNPTNQKIYFGSKNGAGSEPLEFWIAGRETAANGGTISDSGEIMTLYQAKSVESKRFNAPGSGYTVADKAAITLRLADGLSTSYTGSPVSYPELEQNVKFSGQDGLQKDVLQWQHRANTAVAWEDGMPTNAGSYEIRCYATGTDNYERTYSAPVTFTIIDRSGWGTERVIAGIPHWVDAGGTTSVEVTKNGMIWLKEESGGTSAWYGIDNTSGVFEIGSRFWVRWLNRNSDPVEFTNLWDQLDDEHKNSIDGDNAWLFEIGVTAPDGTTYANLSQQVPVYVQIGDDWDIEHLHACHISIEQDESVNTSMKFDVVYPEGQDTFGLMYLSHFSPYFIYDKLTDEEKAKQNQVKTGDQVSLFTISGLGLIMTLALGLMLKTHSSKRKFDE